MADTEYHKIETLYERDEVTHKLKEPLVLKNRIYGMLKTFIWTEKLDGTNIRVMWNHLEKKVNFGGRQGASQIDTQLLAWLQDKFPVSKFEEVFPDADAVIYGEGLGAGIQKGGIYSPKKIFVCFDVLVLDDVAKWWLSQENVEDVAGKFEVKTAPLWGEMTLEEATKIVRGGFNSIFAHENNLTAAPAEGLIGRPVEALFDKKGARIIVKLKTKDFAQVVIPSACTVVS
jgi:hypothetical protein